MYFNRELEEEEAQTEMMSCHFGDESTCKFKLIPVCLLIVNYPLNHTFYHSIDYLPYIIILCVHV